VVITRTGVLVLALILALAGSVAGVASAALASPSYVNNAQGAAFTAQRALQAYRAIPNGTHYGVTCTGYYIAGRVVAGHLPIRVVCYLYPRSR